MSAGESMFIACVVAGVALVITAAYLRLFFMFRGQRVVTCPETRKPAGVEIDAALAARTTLIDDPKLQVIDCSRWPGNAGCLQECLSQVEAGREETLMRNILPRWYIDKDCVSCGRPIGSIRWRDPLPALRMPDGTLRDWSGVAPEGLTAMLATSLPVCWNCRLAAEVRRD